MSWEKIKIGTCCEVTSSKRIFFSEYVEIGVPFYRSKEIIEKSEGKPISEPLFITQEKYKEIAKNYGVPKAGDMLLTSVGTIGIPYIVKDSDYFYFKDGNLTWFRNFNGNLLSKYLFLWVRSPEGNGILNNTTIGSSQKALTISALKQLEFPCPPIEIQQKIVDIISAYDDLIENNQKQIKLLEEMAQRLYKEWFLDLHFPGYETTTIIDGVPVGWKMASLSDICELRKEVLTPANKVSGIPYIGLEHMPRQNFCLSAWGDSSEVNSNKYRYYDNDILFGKIRPYFHKVGFTLNSGIASTDAIVIRAKEGLWGLLLMTVSDKLFVDYTYQTCKEGAKMPRADWNEMRKYDVLIPSENVRLLFEKQIWDISRKLKSLALESHKLTEARDRLLPKLMSGEIEV